MTLKVAAGCASALLSSWGSILVSGPGLAAPAGASPDPSSVAASATETRTFFCVCMLCLLVQAGLLGPVALVPVALVPVALVPVAAAGHCAGGRIKRAARRQALVGRANRASRGPLQKGHRTQHPRPIRLA